MNLVVWLIWGGILGLSFSMFESSSFLAMGDLVASIIGSLLGGYAVSTFEPNIPVGELKPGKFSLGALLAAVVLSIIFVLTYRFFT